MAIFTEKEGRDHGYEIRLVPISHTDLYIKVLDGEDTTILTFGLAELIREELNETSRDLDGDMFLTPVERRRWRRWAALLETQATIIRATISEAIDSGEPRNIDDVFSASQKSKLAKKLKKP